MTRLRRKAGAVVHRLARYRQRRHVRRLYNDQRQQHYAHSSRRQVAGELRVSIVVPCYNPPVIFFEELLSSVLAQSYGHWELVLADGSTDVDISAVIARKARSDTRIVYQHVRNEGIAQTTNYGIGCATGDLIAFLDHDDTLDPDALAFAVQEFQATPEVGLVYSDEDKLSSDGTAYLDPHFKPDFSLDLLRNVNYITHFVVVRADLVRELGGIRTGFDGAQDFDFLLRAVDTGAVVHHIPRILYHWRLSPNSTAADFSSKAHITAAGVKALDDHYLRRGLPGVRATAIADRPGFYRARYPLVAAKRLVLIAPTVEPAPAVTRFLLDSFAANTSLATNDIAVAGAADPVDLARYDQVMLVRGLVIPGSDTSEVAELFAVADEPGIHAVSPKVVSGGKIENMGLVAGRYPGQFELLFAGMDDGDINPFGSVEWVRNVNALLGEVVVTDGRTAAAYLAQPDGPLLAPAAQRLVVWSHVEMLRVLDLDGAQSPTRAQDCYFNANLVTNHAPLTRRTLPVAALLQEMESRAQDAVAQEVSDE